MNHDPWNTQPLIIQQQKGQWTLCPEIQGLQSFSRPGFNGKVWTPQKGSNSTSKWFGKSSLWTTIICILFESYVPGFRMNCVCQPHDFGILTTPRITTCGSRILQIYLSAKNMCPLPNLTKLDPPAADRLFSGTGPLEGWISCSVNGKALVMEARWRWGCGFSRCQFLWTDLAGTPSTGKFKYSMKLDRSFSKNMRVAKRIDESLFVRVETIWISEISRKPFDSTSLVGDLAKGA